ncbi:ADP-forming succinate--CoA ligase subunit beta [Heliorestis acidaminivorans]|uniref:Succinate--CoA ligase [ADP-forming] subunit beta n=1 Tax=Heliorestis acidaminivorans TaxID=553427 RepID=A0A6I0EZQ5_9FIRM|nr:ADP-forming succinate--CoA ligase subunit beta [Heliorestis acidaminivorans]KAB2952531.1 ADP-forming succinate--CoA ligase subunit beta [Heliorestis acidaminivorans]
MKCFEYMGKELFAQYGIPVPSGRMVTTAEEAEKVAAEIGRPVVVKSQVLSGKRGKAGGIKFADTPAEAKSAAKEILAMTVQGLPVNRLLVEEKLKIESEIYVAITIDGASKAPVLITSAKGGMDIEEQAEEDIVKVHLDVFLGLQPFMAKELARKIGLKGALAKSYSDVVQKMYRCMIEKDAELVEINPLVVSGEQVIAADAKVTIDDSALYRQKDIEYVDEDMTEVEKLARDAGIGSFVELGGDIAVMANGAGITMGTLDMVQLFGGEPANFMDAGGGTGVEGTAKAIEILLAQNPKVIFINIFGGITRCDDVAKALVYVKENKGIPVPVVVRMVGTNEQEGVAILKEAGFEAYRDMKTAAQKAVDLSKTGGAE